MRARYRMFRRRGYFYSHDSVTGEQKSLGTKDREAAKKLLFGKNQAHEQPAINLAMARTYLMAKSPELARRTWLEVMAEKEERYVREGTASTLRRWRKVMRSQPFQMLSRLPLVETEPDHFLRVMRHAKAGNSTNKWLRILHNFALDMGWLLAPVLAKKAWPKFRVMDRRGITEQEHRRIQALAGEGTEEADYYEVLWETGGSQSDIATLDADRIDWEQRSILYRRMKTQNRGYEFAKVRLGARLVAVLERLPRQGPLFPQLAAMSLENRARLFRRRVHALGLKNISLHCYRYAWAERARKAQVPLRVAMETLGHQSRAVHQAYAKKVEVDLMPLEYYEQKAKETIVAFQACTQPEPNSAKEPALAVSPG